MFVLIQSENIDGTEWYSEILKWKNTEIDSCDLFLMYSIIDNIDSVVVVWVPTDKLYVWDDQNKCQDSKHEIDIKNLLCRLLIINMLV